MIDSKQLRDDLEGVAHALKRRGYELDVVFWQQIESERKTLQSQTEALQAKRNAGAKQIGQLKQQGLDASDVLAQMQAASAQIKAAEESLRELQQQIHTALLDLPNLPANDVPDGLDETSNKVLRQVGSPPQIKQIQDHTDLGEALGMLDFEMAARMAGSRFAVLSGDLAKLHRALIQFMLDVHTQEYGFTEMYVPFIANQDSLTATGQLPKFADDLFALKGERGFYLIPTAEVPLTNSVRDQILDTQSLPIKLTAHTPCFRSEAGSAGRDTRGLIRQHQFEKVEMVVVCQAEQSDALLEQMTAQAEHVLQALQLPYQVVLLCAGDMGFAAKKTYDLEVWLPSQNTYREISSLSNCGDFQARRLQARVKEGKKTQWVHTLNGSGLAVGRTLLAILENHQQPDGSITLPKVLHPYMGGKTHISLA